MAIRSKTTIIDDAIAFIKSVVPNIATEIGSVVRDLVIESPAEEFDKANQEILRTQKLHSINFPDAMTTEELDSLAANYAILRSEGTPSIGTVTFQLQNFSTSSSDVNIPIGTVVSTIGSDTIPTASFVTTEALFFDHLLAPGYFNPSTGLYELTSSIQAEQIGVGGNVTAGTIVQPITNISGVFSIINTVATTGGEDIENNTDLAARVQIKLSGNSIGTENGILSLLNANANVTDSIVVTPNDVELIRDEFGGEVDVYVIGQNLETLPEITFYDAAGSQEFILLHQPAKSIVSIEGLAGAAPYSFILGVDYNFVLDTTTLLNGSTRLENKVVFNIGGTNPDNGTNITITYTYNKLIETLQSQIDADDGHIVTSDILVKEADEVEVDITADVTLFPGNVSATEIANIQTALSEEINALGLGTNIDRSDIIASIESVESVDQVNVSTLILEKDGVPLLSTEQRLQVFKNEYPRINTITINIV